MRKHNIHPHVRPSHRRGKYLRCFCQLCVEAIHVFFFPQSILSGRPPVFCMHDDGDGDLILSDSVLLLSHKTPRLRQNIPRIKQHVVAPTTLIVFSSVVF